MKDFFFKKKPKSRLSQQLYEVLCVFKKICEYIILHWLLVKFVWWITLWEMKSHFPDGWNLLILAWNLIFWILQRSLCLTFDPRKGSRRWGKTRGRASRAEGRCREPTRSRWTARDCRWVEYRSIPFHLAVISNSLYHQMFVLKHSCCEIQSKSD